jgi:hypothetical protein
MFRFRRQYDTHCGRQTRKKAPLRGGSAMLLGYVMRAKQIVSENCNQQENTGMCAMALMAPALTSRSDRKMDTLGIEPRAFRMRSGCDTTTPCAPCRNAEKWSTSLASTKCSLPKHADAADKNSTSRLRTAALAFILQLPQFFAILLDSPGKHWVLAPAGALCLVSVSLVTCWQ